MNSTAQALSNQLHQVFFGGNWTCVNLKETLSDVSLEQSNQKVKDYNTIGVLTFHIHYFVKVASRVLAGGPLEGNDKLSFSVPDFANETEWQSYLNQIWKDAEVFCELIANLDDTKLWEDFTDPKYGNYYRNIQGIIEHSHYHLGQISLLKKAL